VSVSGSSGPWALLTDEPIRPADVLARVGHDRDGAVLLFLGKVRNHADGRPVRGIRYEAYGPMARSVLEELAREAAERLGTDRVAVVHRTGELEVGEVSVAVAVSSPHRAEAFDAARVLMEELKRRLPVWKHEIYADGTRDWVAGSPIE
jgi:molybdopterin synthase catalytic subunit